MKFLSAGRFVMTLMTVLMMTVLTTEATSFQAYAQDGPIRARALATPVTDPNETLVGRGEYLARAGDCISCHTRPKGAPFAGGLPMKTDFGTIISTNITPDREQGIGLYSQDEFTRALREGKARDGHYLYPAMPYANFARLTDTDLQALYAYFMQGVQPVRQDNAKTDLSWPFRMRWLMFGWNTLYLSGKPYQPDTEKSAEWNRGAYLVQGLGHCSACHTPRGLIGAEKASTEKEGKSFLAGALIDGWYAQPLRNTVLPGLATWSQQDIVEYLKTGRTGHTAAFGAMTEVVGNSTQHLTREDLAAVASYLKSVGEDGAISGVNASSVIKSADPGQDATAIVLRAGNTSQRGAMVYLNNCSACHRSDGRGAGRTFPSLARNSAVAAEDPTSLIRLVLQGSAMPHTAEAPSELAMPRFDWRLSDDNVADLLSFIRSSWGNQAAPVHTQAVSKVRSTSGNVQPQRANE